MSLGPFAGITGSLKALRDIFPASTDTKINRLDATISSRLSETLGARQIELNAVKAKTDTIDQAALVTAITGATRGANMFLSTQNWTVPAGTTLIYITAQAGGGGGGSSGTPNGNTYGSGGAGGGSSGQAILRIAYPVSAGDVLAIGVGSGGAGGVAGSAGGTGSNGLYGGTGSDSIVTIGTGGSFVDILRVAGGYGGGKGYKTNNVVYGQDPNNGRGAVLNELYASNFLAGQMGGLSKATESAGNPAVSAMGRYLDNGGGAPNGASARWGGAGGGGGHSLHGFGGFGATGTTSIDEDGNVGLAGTMGSGGGGAGGAYRDYDSSDRVGAAGGAGGNGFVLIEF